MKKTVLFIAMSLDGYLADAHGGTGWLEGQAFGENDMVSSAFCQVGFSYKCKNRTQRIAHCARLHYKMFSYAARIKYNS